MTADEFVRGVERSVRDAAIKSSLANLCDPPGREPDPALLNASRWFKALGDSDRSVVEWIIRLAADHATFGFLCVIDGARAISPGPQKGQFELIYREGECCTLINDISRDEPLNDKFR